MNDLAVPRVNPGSPSHVLGCDPDTHGGFVVIDGDARIVKVRRIPVRQRKVGKRMRREMLYAETAALFRQIAGEFPLALAVVEAASTGAQRRTRTRDGLTGTRDLGPIHQTVGAIRMLGAVYATRVELAWPSAWKRKMGTTSDKERSVYLAREEFPESARLFTHANHGLAEAALIALYGLRHLAEKS